MPIDEKDSQAHYEAYCKDPDTRLIAPPKADAPFIEFKERRDCQIWQGYLDASHILLGKVLDGGPFSGGLIFPALLNLRHGIEVALKWHINYAGGVVPKHVGHNLNLLIDAFRRTADDIDEDISYVHPTVLNQISELASIDPRSLTFRYSTELDGSPIDITPQKWDLRRLYYGVGDLIVIIDAMSDWIDRTRNEDYVAFMRS